MRLIRRKRNSQRKDNAMAKKKTSIITIKPAPMKSVAIYFILSVLVVIAPITLAILIDIRFIALLSAFILPMCYMIYRVCYLEKCSIKINYSDRTVIIKKPLKTRTLLIDNITWSARKVGVRSTSYIIKVVSDSKTIIKLRDDNWENIKELFYLPHRNRQTERDCMRLTK